MGDARPNRTCKSARVAMPLLTAQNCTESAELDPSRDAPTDEEGSSSWKDDSHTRMGSGFQECFMAFGDRLIADIRRELRQELEEGFRQEAFRRTSANRRTSADGGLRPAAMGSDDEDAFNRG